MPDGSAVLATAEGGRGLRHRGDHPAPAASLEADDGVSLASPRGERRACAQSCARRRPGRAAALLLAATAGGGALARWAEIVVGPPKSPPAAQPPGRAAPPPGDAQALGSASEWRPAVEPADVDLLLQRVWVRTAPRGRAVPSSATARLFAGAAVEYGAEPAATEARQPENDASDPRGTLLPEGSRKLAEALRLDHGDSLFGIGDGASLLTLALSARPRLAVSATDNPSSHAALVATLDVLVGDTQLAADAGAPGVTEFRACYSAREGLVDSCAGHATATAALLLGAKLQGDRLLAITRELAMSLMAGAAVVVQERLLHCHAGLVGPLFEASLAFSRLPRGGRVFVYLVAPPLPAPGLARPRISPFEADPTEVEHILGDGAAAATSEALIAAIQASAEATGTPLWLRHAHSGLVGADGLGGVRAWALGRALGGAGSPLECLFRDAFALVAGSERAAAKLSPSEAEALAGGAAAATYSELSPASLKALLALLPVPIAGDVFADLGSGLGKIAFQVALTSPMLARGAEQVPSRHMHARAAWELMRAPGALEALGPLLGSPRWPPLAAGSTSEGAPHLLGAVELIQRNVRPEEYGPDALWKDASIILLHVLADAQSAALRFELAAALAEDAEPGTVLISLSRMRGCHRGLRLLREQRVKVDWSPTLVPAYVYLAVRPEVDPIASPLPPALLRLDSGMELRRFRCLALAGLIADRQPEGSQPREEAAGSVARRLEGARRSAGVAAGGDWAHWLHAGRLQGDSPSTWDCLFQDLDQLFEFEAANGTRGGDGSAATRRYWRDSTSANADAGLKDLEWSSLGGPRTYGEILPSSVASLLEALALGKDDVFYDLGSGAGKVVLQAHLQTKVRRAAGVELEESRHLAAERLLRLTRRIGLAEASPERSVQFALGDATDASLWADATVVFMLCTCFPREVLAKVASAVLARPPGTRLVTASFPLPPTPTGRADGGGNAEAGGGGGHVLQLTQHLILPTTFSLGEPFFFYEVVEAGIVTTRDRGEAAAAAEALATQMAG